MEVIYIIAILVAFVLGATVRKPFSFTKTPEEKKPEEPELTEEEKKAKWWAQAQLDNIINAGNPGYKQKRLEDYDG